MPDTVKNLQKRIFKISDPTEFETCALEVFQFQAKNVSIYKNYLDALNIVPESINSLVDIPFLPIEFFKQHSIIIEGMPVQRKFQSSGTTGSDRSIHCIADPEVYELSMLEGFKAFYGDPQNYCFMALLPSYMENSESSLIYMVDRFIHLGVSKRSGYYLLDQNDLAEKLQENEREGVKTFLIGVTYALLDFSESHKFDLNHTIICETGGMKGRRKEMIREEVHDIIRSSFNLKNVHSEYGMTELLSQAWSRGNGLFECPPWMKVLIRDVYDPFSYQNMGKTGGINIVDLANLYSCSFIATSDLGRIKNNEQFEILGRFDNSDIRGCNLLVI